MYITVVYSIFISYYFHATPFSSQRLIKVGQAAASPSVDTPRAEIAARAREAMQKRREGTPTSGALAKVRTKLKRKKGNNMKEKG